MEFDCYGRYNSEGGLQHCCNGGEKTVDASACSDGSDDVLERVGGCGDAFGGGEGDATVACGHAGAETQGAGEEYECEAGVVGGERADCARWWISVDSSGDTAGDSEATFELFGEERDAVDVDDATGVSAAGNPAPRSE